MSSIAQAPFQAPTQHHHRSLQFLLQCKHLRSPSKPPAQQNPALTPIGCLVVKERARLLQHACSTCGKGQAKPTIITGQFIPSIHFMKENEGPRSSTCGALPYRHHIGDQTWGQAGSATAYVAARQYRRRNDLNLLIRPEAIDCVSRLAGSRSRCRGEIRAVCGVQDCP